MVIYLRIPETRSATLAVGVGVVRVVAIIAVILAPWPVFAQLAVLGAASAANFDSGVTARGGLASLFVRGLDITRPATAVTMPLPVELAGVRLIIGEAPAPLLAVIPAGDSAQINFQVPVEARFRTLDVECVLEAGAKRVTVSLPIRPWSPGDFFVDQRNYAVAQHASDYSSITREAPARPGETVVAYLTGLPMPEPAIPSGHPAPADPLAALESYRRAETADEYSILIDGQPVEPLFIGLVPGLVGVFQVNFTVPPNQTGGERRLALRRAECRAAAGNCLNGGGSWVRYNSSAVLFPIR